jgi:hypothetical protein
MPQRSTEVAGQQRKPGPPKVDKKPTLEPNDKPAPPEDRKPN